MDYTFYRNVVDEQDQRLGNTPSFLYWLDFSWNLTHYVYNFNFSPGLVNHSPVFIFLQSFDKRVTLLKTNQNMVEPSDNIGSAVGVRNDKFKSM